jgi:type IV fimbrial biogenesis protein FimT
LPSIRRAGTLRAMDTRHQQGFNLLELMATVAILGVLLGLGVPAFNDLIRNNRVVADTNKLVVALSSARSEAVRRGLPISVCATNSAQTACVATANWAANGWMVFTDATGTAGTFDGTDEILQKFARAGSGVGLNSSNTTAVRFLSTGLPPSGAPLNTVFTVQHSICRDDNRRTVRITRTGRLNTTKGACS